MEEFEDVLKKEVTEFIDKHTHWGTGEVIASTYVGFHMVNVVMDKLQNKSSNSDYVKCNSIGCQFYDEKLEFNCCANESLCEKCMNSQQFIRSKHYGN